MLVFPIGIAPGGEQGQQRAGYQQHPHDDGEDALEVQSAAVPEPVKAPGEGVSIRSKMAPKALMPKLKTAPKKRRLKSATQEISLQA